MKRGYREGQFATGRSMVGVFGRAWRADPSGVAQLVVIAGVLGMLPAAQVKITAHLVTAVVDSVGKGGAVEGVLAPLTALAVTGLAAQVLQAFQQRSTLRCQSRLSASLSRQIIDRAACLTLPQVEDAGVQDSLQRAVREVNFRPGQMLTQSIQLITQVITFGSVTTVLWTMDYRVALLALLAPFPTVIAQVVQGRRGYALEHSRSQLRRRLNYWQYLASRPDSMKEVITFSLRSLVLRRHLSLQSEIVAADVRLADRNLRLSIPLMTITAALIFAANSTAVMTVGGGSAIAELMAVIQAVGALQSSTQQLFTAGAQLHVDQLYLRNVEDFLGIPEPQVEGGILEVPEKLEQGIEFRNVSFRYPGSDRYALRNIDVTLQPGRTTAIVGLNGAGKSTLGKLMGRLYEPSDGVILLDGVPLRRYDMASLRRRISYVFQDYVDYQLSVGENISIGHVDECGDPATADAVAHAAKQVEMGEYIESLPLGYDTQAGKVFTDGVELSGGQWQRLAIARGLIRPATIRVMDEPTASIDAPTESAIMNTITRPGDGEIFALIAHRLSTIRRADRILVLDNSRLVEDGSHEELIRHGGVYAKMYGNRHSRTVQDDVR
ncbi:ABC transporter ATP-binding protein [Nocardia sp. NPDC052254]|uniref:ABC transporter ATP-binding protein n=1 Tax=Nocardia sp. NPDC052254 TaxID=3155681 RepID=UPI00341FEAF6